MTPTDLRYFAYAHLPLHLAIVSEPFAMLAHKIVEQLPHGPQRDLCLQKLLEAKDCAVRCALSMPADEMAMQGYRRIDPSSIPEKQK
jgi:hypothetical protein